MRILCSVKVKSKGKTPAEPKKKGFFERLADKAEELQKQMEEQQKQQAGKGKGGKGKGKGKGKR